MLSLRRREMVAALLFGRVVGELVVSLAASADEFQIRRWCSEHDLDPTELLEAAKIAIGAKLPSTLEHLGPTPEALAQIAMECPSDLRAGVVLILARWFVVNVAPSDRTAWVRAWASETARLNPDRAFESSRKEFLRAVAASEVALAAGLPQCASADLRPSHLRQLRDLDDLGEQIVAGASRGALLRRSRRRAKSGKTTLSTSKKELVG
jgi:hypothetical protein